MADMRKETISITAPAAQVGQAVRVFNYKRRPGQWEPGVVRSVSYCPAYQIDRHDGSNYQVQENWTYEVWVERPLVIDHYGRRKGGGYRLTVGDDSIRVAR